MKHLLAAFLLLSIFCAVSAQVAFTENWSDQNFDSWTFSPANPGNWEIETETGNPSPCCRFNYSPTQTNYSFALVSNWIPAMGYTDPWLRMDVSLDNYSTDTVENLRLQVCNPSGLWHTLAEWDNTACGFGWTRQSYDLSAVYDGTELQIRIEAWGENSYNINGWRMDNIVIEETPAQTTVSGVVTSSAPPNDPIQCARVDFSGWSALTDEYGVYTVTIPDGVYNAVCSADGYNTNTDHTYLSITGLVYSLDIELDPNPVLSGVVTDILNGAPIEGAEVNAYSTTLDMSENTLTAADGSYSLSLPGADDWSLFCTLYMVYEDQNQSDVSIWTDTTMDWELTPLGAADFDNAPENATQVTLPYAMEGIIYASGDNDWFYFHGMPNHTYAIWTEAYAGGDIDPIIEMNGPSSGPPFSDIDPYTALWSDDDSAGGNQPFLEFTVSPGESGYYLVRLIAQAPGDIGYYRLHIEEDTAITASFFVEEFEGVTPFTALFTDTSTGIITEWHWDFGDGGTSSEQNPTHVYETAGLFTVSLQVSSPVTSDYVEYTNFIEVRVGIPDTAFRIAINEALGYVYPETETHNPTPQEMDSIIELDASYSSISDITGAEYLTGCQVLNLAHNNITDLSPLSDVNNILSLNLAYNSIHDITPLSVFTYTDEFDVSGNMLSNPMAMSAWTGAVVIAANNCELNNLDPFAGLTGLQSLSVSGNAINDLSPLMGLTGLLEFNAEANQILDLSPLAGLPLEALRLPGNYIGDITPLSSIATLQTLNLNDNSVVDLSPLAGLDNLTNLYVRDNDVRFVNAIMAMDGLTRVDLDDNNISDIWALTQSPALSDGDDSLSFANNPLSYEAYYTHLPVLGAMNWLTLTTPDDYEPLAPGYPSPGRVTTDVSVNTNLEWETEAVGVNSYIIQVFDGDGTEVAYSMETPAPPQTHYSYPVSLDAGTDYTWMVTATTSSGDYYGGVWGFTTQGNSVSADFTATNASGPAPLTVQFHDASTANGTTITEWIWDYDNDGTPDDVFNTPTDPTHTYYDGGSYDVSLTVTDGVVADTVVFEDMVTVENTYIPDGGPITGVYNDGLVVVEGEAIVPLGGTLEVHGAGFQFQPGARLVVNGSLIVTGGGFTASDPQLTWSGFYFSPGSENCSVSNVSLVGAAPGLEIEGCSPEFHSVNLQIDAGFDIPPNTWAAYVCSGATPWFDNLHVSGYDYGVHLQDIDPIGRNVPVLSDLLLECRVPAAATDACGLLLQNATVQADGLEVNDFIYGVSVDTWSGGARNTPTLTNIRVRNTGNSTRDDDVGLYLKDVSEIVVEGDSISEYSVGIVVETTDGLRDVSTPTITNIRVRNTGSATREGDAGMALYGNVSGSFENIHFAGYSSGVLISADAGAAMPTSPWMHNISITTDSLTVMRLPMYGLATTGTVSCAIDSLYIEGYPAGVLIEDQAGGGGRSTPTLTNIRVRNTGSATRVDSVGVAVSGPIDAVISDALIEDFATGLLLSNTDTRDVSTPTLTNIRVRNTGSATRTDSWGLRIEGGVAAQVHGAETIDCTYGVYYSDYAGGLRETPTLTNIRVRNTGNATREAAIGVWISEVSEITVSGDSIVGYPVGVQVESTPGRSESTPTLTNIRVRNTGSATRPANVGVQMFGGVTPILDNLEIMDFDYGVHITGDGVLRRDTPTLTNIRVRNTGSATRTPMTGVTIIDVPNVVLQADTIWNYSTGYEVVNNTGGPTSVTAQYLAAHQEMEDMRLEGVGLTLGDGVDGVVLDSEFSGYGCGVLAGDGYSNVQGGSFRNCDRGVDVHGAGQADINYNVFFLDDDYPLGRLPGPALHMHGVAGANLDNNTIDKYNTGVQADTSNVTMKQSIIWSDPPLPEPIVINGGAVQATYCDISFTQEVWGDSTNMNDDPQFVDASEGDFHLTVFSPCIDCGDPNAPWDPEGNAPDIGALRYPHMAAFEVDPRFGTTGAPVQFTDLSIGHPRALTTYEWDFNNDGTIDSFEPSPTYTFDEPGVYDILFVATSAALVDSSYHYHFCVYQQDQLNAPQAVLVQHQGDDIHLAWQPVTNTIHGAPVAVDYYLVFAAPDPQGTFEFLDITLTSAYTHLGATLQHDRCYYFVLAYAGTMADCDAFLSDHAALRFESDGPRWVEQKKSVRQ